MEDFSSHHLLVQSLNTLLSVYYWLGVVVVAHVHGDEIKGKLKKSLGLDQTDAPTVKPEGQNCTKPYGVGISKMQDTGTNGRLQSHNGALHLTVARFVFLYRRGTHKNMATILYQLCRKTLRLALLMVLLHFVKNDGGLNLEFAT